MTNKQLLRKIILIAVLLFVSTVVYPFITASMQ